LDTAGCTQRLSAFGIKWKIKELKAESCKANGEEAQSSKTEKKRAMVSASRCTVKDRAQSV